MKPSNCCNYKQCDRKENNVLLVILGIVVLVCSVCVTIWLLIG